MRHQVKLGNDQTITVTNEAVKDVVLKFVGIHNNVNTTPANLHIVNLNKVRVTAVLFQEGQEITLFNGPLAPLDIESALHEPNRLKHYTGSAGEQGPKATVLQPAAASVFWKGAYEAKISLGQGIVLKGSDKIVFTITAPVDSVSAVLSNNSYIEFATIEGVINQYTIPVIELHNVDAERTQFDRTLGDNVQSVAVVQSAPDAFPTEALTKFTELRLKSDRLNKRVTFQDMLLERPNYTLDSPTLGSVFLPVNESELDRVAIGLDVNPANITVGQFYLVVRKFVILPQIVERAVHRRQKHDFYALSKG